MIQITGLQMSDKFHLLFAEMVTNCPYFHWRSAQKIVKQAKLLLHMQNRVQQLKNKKRYALVMSLLLVHVRIYSAQHHGGAKVLEVLIPANYSPTSQKLQINVVAYCSVKQVHQKMVSAIQMKLIQIAHIGHVIHWEIVVKHSMLA